MTSVAIISDILPGNIGGVERFTASIIGELERKNIKVSSYDRGSVDGWQEKWYDKYIVSARSNLLVGRAAWNSFISNKEYPDVIIQNSISGWNLRSKNGIPRIVIHHGSIRGLYYIALPSSVKWRTRLNRYIGLICLGGGLEQYIARGAVSVAVSSSVADELRSYYSGINPVVIPNGIDIKHYAKRDRSRCRHKFGIEQEEFVACFTGRFGLLGKGFAELHELSSIAWEARLKIKFLIATNEIPSGWPPNVIFLKNVSYEYMPEVYSAADVFVFPTRYEGCSYSLLEAMACELPILTTRVGYAHDLHRDIPEVAPYILEENNVSQYWKLLQQLAGDDPLVKKLGHLCADYVRCNNSLDVMVESYIKLINLLAKRR